MKWDGINPHVFTMEQDEFIKALDDIQVRYLGRK